MTEGWRSKIEREDQEEDGRRRGEVKTQDPRLEIKSTNETGGRRIWRRKIDMGYGGRNENGTLGDDGWRGEGESNVRKEDGEEDEDDTGSGEMCDGWDGRRGNTQQEGKERRGRKEIGRQAGRQVGSYAQGTKEREKIPGREKRKGKPGGGGKKKEEGWGRSQLSNSHPSSTSTTHLKRASSAQLVSAVAPPFPVPRPQIRQVGVVLRVRVTCGGGGVGAPRKASTKHKTGTSSARALKTSGVATPGRRSLAHTHDEARHVASGRPRIASYTGERRPAADAEALLEVDEEREGGTDHPRETTRKPMTRFAGAGHGAEIEKRVRGQGGEDADETWGLKLPLHESEEMTATHQVPQSPASPTYEIIEEEEERKSSGEERKGREGSEEAVMRVTRVFGSRKRLDAGSTDPSSVKGSADVVIGFKAP
ncbi:hypothetical protein B0H11DRAFT_2351279 [Mycena galericulata]|nr:hypothetical protein B0H11DRAFT_2351279 [Mycena galericulata]